MANSSYLNSKPTSMGFGLTNQNEEMDITPPASSFRHTLESSIRIHPKKRLRDQIGPKLRTGPQKRQTYNKLLGGNFYVAAAEYLKAIILRKRG